MSNTKAKKVENIRQVAYGAKQVADFMNFQLRIGTEVDSEEYSRFFYWASEFIQDEIAKLDENNDCIYRQHGGVRGNPLLR